MLILLLLLSLFLFGGHWLFMALCSAMVHPLINVAIEIALIVLAFHLIRRLIDKYTATNPKEQAVHVSDGMALALFVVATFAAGLCVAIGLAWLGDRRMSGLDHLDDTGADDE